MRQGVYSTANLRRMRMMPFGYRCGACGALNYGYYPLGVSESVRDAAEASLNANGRELTQAELNIRAQRATWAALSEMHEQIDSRKWSGSPNGVAVCGKCGGKACWSRQSMKPRDWIITMLIPLGAGLYELVYEGLYYGVGWAVLLGIIILCLAVPVIIAAAAVMIIRKRKIDRLPRESLPTLFNEAWELESWLALQRKPDESVFRCVDPRSPDAPALEEENARAAEALPPDPFVLCKSCLRILPPDAARTFEGKGYCADCYGIVRQEAEHRAYLNTHKKRGGDIR